VVNHALIGSVRLALAACADPSKAPGMQAYMKSEMPYLGINSTPLRDALRQVVPEYELASFDDWRDTILDLWHTAQFREERYAALALVGDRRYRAYRTLDALPLYEQLIVNGAWWDLVDGLATHEVGDRPPTSNCCMRASSRTWLSTASFCAKRLAGHYANMPKPRLRKSGATSLPTNPCSAASVAERL
jgi:3-methyladenine DNA glycosylase AlkD